MRASASIRLGSVDGPWRSGEERRKFEASTLADGSFELLVPLPTADWISLFVQPQPYLDIDGRDFGPAGGRDRPRLVEGDNALGEFRLAATGAIAGRVVDARGEPIAKAQVRLAGSFPGGYSRSALSDDAGEYLVGHVPAGSYGLEILADGYLMGKLGPQAVATRATTRAPGIELQAAPTIAGVVVDASGAPIADARVWGWPAGGGNGAGARTDANGRFSVPLKHAVPHRFEVTAAGFAKHEDPHRTRHPVGASDVRIALRAPELTTFVVLDASSGAPVTRYALRLDWRPTAGGSRSGGEPTYALAERPGGEFTCEADPQKFQYRITSPGYAPAEGAIVHESASSRRVLVRLRPESVVRGRVLLRGAPVPQAKLLLYAGSLLRLHEDDGEPAATFDEQSWFWNDLEGVRDLVFVLPKPSAHRTDATGAFTLAELATGEYRLEIEGPEGARRSLDPLAVFEGEPLELGDLELTPSGTIAGEVLLPHGIDPATVHLECVSWGRAVRTQVGADRRFRFEHVPAGRAHIGLSKALGLVRWGPYLQRTLAPGGSEEVVLDLTARASVETSLTVLVNGEPAEGVRVWLQQHEGKLRDTLDKTDARGRAAGAVLALGPTDVRLGTQSGMRLGTFERVLDITVGATPRVTLDVPCGSLEVEWPALRDDEPLYLVQLSAFHDSEAKRTWANAMPGFEAPEHDARITGPNRALFRYVPPGVVEWRIQIQTVEGHEVQREHTFQKQLEVRAGALTRCVLTEADRVRDE